MARTKRSSEALPLHEELDALSRRYHHLHNEIERTRPSSSTRGDLEDELLQVRERFDRILDEWVPDDELRDQWNAYLHTHAPEPDGPRGIDPVVFRGVSDAGSVVEVRRRGDEFQVWIDGALVERVAAEKDFGSRVPGLTFSVDGFEFREKFTAPPDAVSALAGFLEQGGRPPWEQARELLEDGLVDVHFGVTPRGHRAISTFA